MKKICIIIVSCFLIRFIYWYFWNKIYNPIASFGDSFEYVKLGENFFEKGEFIYKGKASAKRPPVYPIYLGITQKIFGKTNYHLWTLGHIFLSCFSAILLFFTCRLLFNETLGEKIGIISSVFYIIDPLMIMRIPHIATEPLFSFLIICLIFFILFEYKYKNIISQLMLGILLSLVALCRAEGFLFLILFPFVFVIFNKVNLKNIQRLLVIVLFSLLTMSPWWIRNYKVFKTFIPISTFGGYNFLSDCGAHPLKEQGYWSGLSKLFFEYDNKKEHEVIVDKMLYKEKIKNVLQHPIDGIKLVIKNFLILHYFTSFPRSDRFDPVYGMMLIFTIIGLYLLLCKKNSNLLKVVFYSLFTIYFSFVVAYSFYSSDPRMRNSIEPIFIILASFGITKLFKVNKRMAFYTLLVSIIVNVLLFFTYSSYIKPFIFMILNKFF